MKNHERMEKYNYLNKLFDPFEYCKMGEKYSG